MSRAVSIDLDARRTPAPLWLGAAVLALALHAACVALAYTQMASDEDSDALGSPAIEIGLEMMAPRAEPSDLPPGPDSEASAASPAQMQQEAVVKETDLPKAVPMESEEPDRIVTPDDNKKPKEEDAEKAAVQTTASVESLAAEATAMPTSETAPEGPKSVAPVQGIGQAAQRVRMTWQREISAYLERHKRYPADRVQKNVEITVRFSLDRVGRLQDVSIVRGSGDPAFDDAAIAMVRRSDPLPAPPPVIADDNLSFTVPVVFRVKGARG